MAIINQLTSPCVQSKLLKPALDLVSSCVKQRVCPEISDADWLRIGVARCLTPLPSGRAFLQDLGSTAPEHCPENSNFFESLKSKRRLGFCRELNAKLRSTGNRLLPDRLAALSCLDAFDIYAADGHFHGHAAHDKADDKGVKYATGHLYSRNLRTGQLAHLTALDEISRKKEHDLRALKRLTTDALRQGAPKGRKVIMVYDRAVIDFTLWYNWKYSSALYTISRTKENLVLEVVGNLPFCPTDPLNAGVIADQLVAPATGGEALRRVTFKDVCTGEIYEFLTNLLDGKVQPGVIAFLYRCRWGIEKSFDEFKNKLGEQKAWASSATAKSMQGEMLCLTMNLIALIEHQLTSEEGIRNEPEEQRRAKRLAGAKAQAAKVNEPLPQAVIMVQAMTQHGVKLIRWLAARFWSGLPWILACPELARLYRWL
jgi:Transposase DDE domain